MDIRWNGKNERVNGTTLQDLAMRISENTHVGIGFVTRQNELNLPKTTISDCPREVFHSLTFDEVPDSLRKPVNTKI